MKVGIAGADPAYAILAHENRGVQVVEQVPAHIGQLPHDLCQYRPMARRRYEQVKSRSFEQCREKIPGLYRLPRRRGRTCMGGDPQKLVTDPPSQIRRRWVVAGLQDTLSTWVVIRRIFVDFVDQDIGVKDQHSPLVEKSVEPFAVGDVNPEPPASPGRQRWQGVRDSGAWSGVRENPPEPRFHQGRHGGSPPRRLFPQLPHDGLVDIQRRFHVVFIWQNIRPVFRYVRGLMAAAPGPLREARALAGAARVVRRTAAVRQRSGHVPGVEQSGGFDDGPGRVRGHGCGVGSEGPRVVIWWCSLPVAGGGVRGVDLPGGDAGDHERAAGRAGIEHQRDRHLGVEPDAPHGFGAAWTRTGCPVFGLEQAPLRVH